MLWTFNININININYYRSVYLSIVRPGMLGGMRVYSGLRISKKKAQYKNKSLRGNKREKKRKKALSGTPTPELSP
jgi:hypothetical protein